jgi:hypothetical protein
MHPGWIIGSHGQQDTQMVTTLDEPHDIMGLPGPVTPLQRGPNLLRLKCTELFPQPEYHDTSLFELETLLFA